MPIYRTSYGATRNPNSPHIIPEDKPQPVPNPPPPAPFKRQREIVPSPALPPDFPKLPKPTADDRYRDLIRSVNKLQRKFADSILTKPRRKVK